MATPAPAAPAATISTLHFVTHGQNIPIRFPDAPTTGKVLREVLGGQSYPAPKFLLRRPITILDIGANVGAAALYFKNAYPDALIHSFEPAPDVNELLRLNVAPFPDIRVHPYGLHDHEGSAQLHLGRSSSVQSSLFKSPETGGKVQTIQLRRASDEVRLLNLPHISILKIDTEGCEIPILADLAAELPRVEVVFLEYHSEADRLWMDQFLSRRFVMFFSSARIAHRGTCGYVARELGRHAPGLFSYEIASSSS